MSIKSGLPMKIHPWGAEVVAIVNFPGGQGREGNDVFVDNVKNGVEANVVDSIEVIGSEIDE